MRLFYREGAYLAGVPISWGLFGPALAGILITRVLNPMQKGNRRKIAVLAFSLGLVVSALVSISFTYFQVNLAWTTEIALGVVLMGLLIAIPPGVNPSRSESSLPARAARPEIERAPHVSQ